MARKAGPGNKKDHKCTRQELNKRIELVLQLRLQGFSIGDINQYIAKNTDWKLAQRSAYRYARWADNRIYQEAQLTHSQWIAKCAKRFEDLYRIAYKDDKHSECRKILLDANKVLGHEKLTIEHEGEIKFELKLPEDLQ